VRVRRAWVRLLPVRGYDRRRMGALIAVAAGGAIGAVARYLLAVAVQARWPGPFPAGTFVVNVTGCLLIGMLAGTLETRAAFSPAVRLFIAPGILGAFTTFSTFGLETVAALTHGQVGIALANIALSVLAGLAAVATGIWLGRLI
jgi:fluoride exporter